MRINVAIPEKHVTKPILDASLEAVTRLNEDLISEGEAPHFDDVKHRIRWKPEPFTDGEHFDHALKVIGRGWGDCDDQAAYLAASLRTSGEDPGAKAVVRRSGKKKWHAVVKRSDGSVDDPSVETGMPTKGGGGVNGSSVLSPMSSSGHLIHGVGGDDYLQLPNIAVRGVVSGGDISHWQARVDLPWDDEVSGVAGQEGNLVTLARGPLPREAICGAIDGLVQLAESSDYCDPDDIDCTEAVGWVCGGCDYGELVDEFGEEVADAAWEHVDGLFKKIGSGLKKISKPIVKAVTSKAGRGLISLVPGVGPAAATALDVASPALNKLVDSKPKSSSSRVTTPTPVNPFSMIKASRETTLSPVPPSDGPPAPGTLPPFGKPKKGKKQKVKKAYVYLMD